MTSPSIDMTLLEQAVRRLPDDSLATIRNDALQSFGETGFPEPRAEDWKYTNLAAAVELSNAWLRDPGSTSPGQALSPALEALVREKTAGIDAYWLIVANGVVNGASVDALPVEPENGLSIRSTSRCGGIPPLVTAEAMSRFNAALLRDVLHIEVGKRAVIDKPIGLLLLDDTATAVTQTRIVIDLAEGADARFIEMHATTGDGDQFANTVTELRLGRGAKAGFVRLQERGPTHMQVGRLTARLARDAVLNHAAFDMGGALVRNDVAVDIVEPGVTVTLHGLYLANGHQHIDNHTRIDHRVGPARSIEEYRGILNDHARCVFNGKAIVHPGADGTDAQQANHNLLLSERAEIDTKPELEIYADDVKCSHGATVGQLDATALFYLRSRGLDRAHAARILTRAFAATAVEHVPVIEARACIEAAIEKHLQTLSQGDMP